MAASQPQKLKSGHEVVPYTKEEFEKYSKNMFPMFEGVCKVNPGNWFISSTLPPILDLIYDFDVGL